MYRVACLLWDVLCNFYITGVIIKLESNDWNVMIYKRIYKRMRITLKCLPKIGINVNPDNQRHGQIQKGGCPVKKNTPCSRT